MTTESVFNKPPFFEGVEKLLEVWFQRKDGNSKHCDLRSIPRKNWDALLKSVHCEVISFSRNEYIDAYVLSESSMFVARRRFILKTCGNTTPLECLDTLTELAKNIAGFDDIEDIFYSRKNFKKPELQKTPHRDFDQEVKFLDTKFIDGSAYCLGSVNRDCWYLYTLNPLRVGIGNSPSLCSVGLIDEPDQTLEILMTELDPEMMKLFDKSIYKTAAQVTQVSGIANIMDNVTIDDYLFDPCGYSMNGILTNGCYVTIHVTPEPDFSYVSFESNIPQSSYMEVIAKVLKVFMPKQFILTVFANHASVAQKTPKELQQLVDLGEWVQRDNQCCHFKGYDLLYSLYTRFPS